MIYKRALVTGGAGFIGSHLSGRLIDKGIKVTVIDNLSVGKIENIPGGAEFIKGDILDGKLMKDLVREKNIDIIFHEAANVTIRGSLNDYAGDANINIMGTLNVLSACQDSKVKKIVYASSMAVYADSASPEPMGESYTMKPISPYGISKLSSEKYCLLLASQMGIPCTVLRYFNTYGIGQQFTPYVGVITIFITKLLKGETLQIFGDGEQRRDFIHVSDIVNANILAMEKSHNNNIFNIGTGNATLVNELADILRSKINPDVDIVHAPEHPGEIRNSIADITLAREYLGFNPEKTFFDSIDEIITWNRKRLCRQ